MIIMITKVNTTRLETQKDREEKKNFEKYHLKAGTQPIIVREFNKIRYIYFDLNYLIYLNNKRR